MKRKREIEMQGESGFSRFGFFLSYFLMLGCGRRNDLGFEQPQAARLIISQGVRMIERRSVQPNPRGAD